MNIVYQDETITLYNNDMKTIINDIKFDFIITDPPYNINFKYIDYKDVMSSEDYISMLSMLNDYKTVMIHYAEEFMGDVGEAMGKPHKCVTWCYNSNLLRQSRMIAWFKCAPDFNKIKKSYKNENDKRIKKLIENGSKGARMYDWWNDIQLVKNISKEKTKFTNQIPIKLLERIILLTTKEGDIICDPFFGSGSLYFACKNTKRKCIGIEQSKQHIDIFLDRINI